MTENTKNRAQHIVGIMECSLLPVLMFKVVQVERGKSRVSDSPW